jgi:hypothetical protein
MLDLHDFRNIATMPQPILNARALKCTIVLDPVEAAQIGAADGKPRVVIGIRLPDRRVSDLNAKSPRKALAAISEYGPDGVAVVIQGKLVGGDVNTEAGTSRSRTRGPRPRRWRHERPSRAGQNDRGRRHGARRHWNETALTLWLAGGRR